MEWTVAQDQVAAIRLVNHAIHEAGLDRELRFLAMPPREPYELPAHVAAKLHLAYNHGILSICHDV